jgi:hypothetical protein
MAFFSLVFSAVRWLVREDTLYRLGSKRKSLKNQDSKEGIQGTGKIEFQWVEIFFS